MKKGDIIYILVTVGKTTVINAYKLQVESTRKKEGQLYSVRGTILQTFSVERGIDSLKYKRTFQYNSKAYRFFSDRTTFVNNLHHNISNMIDICHRGQIEITRFT